MIKTYISKVKRAFQYCILLLFIFELEAYSGVDIEKLLPSGGFDLVKTKGVELKL